MKLTPIKIRGKRGASKPWRPPDPSRVAKRRKKDEAGTSTNGNADASTMRPTKRRKVRKSPTGIEDLPNEILERIVLMSANVNVIRSSLIIGRKLSNRSFCLQLLITCFRPTWDQWFGVTTEKVEVGISHKRRVPSQPVRGNPKFQSEVLASPWVTVGLILQAQEMWYRQECREGRGRNYQQAPSWLLLDLTEKSHHPELVTPAVEEISSEGDVARTHFESDWGSFMVKFGAGKYTTTGRLRKTTRVPTPGYVDVHPDAKIPDSILKGPPDWDKAKLLFWLIRAGACIHPDQTYELTRDGFDQIMIKGRSGNEDDGFLAAVMLYLFYSLDVFQHHWPHFLLESKRAGLTGGTGIDTFACSLMHTKRQSN